MKIPLSWLREYVPVPIADTAEDVMAQLVTVGLEEEGVIRRDISGPIVVGNVLSYEPEEHKNGKTINWCYVDVGGKAPRGIVCGAHNFTVGDKIVACLPGASLPGGFKISARKTYGHVSDGMMASSRELGLGQEHEGILRFADLGLDPEIGADALEVLGLTDEAADINVTPDRSYCLSIRGVAREYSHAVNGKNASSPFVDPGFVDPASDYRGEDLTAPAATADGYEVSLQDTGPIHGKPGANRFVARTVRHVNPTAPTPPWMQERLQLSGIHPRSIIVDITNYVMLELGQPLHAYDMDKIAGGLVVRRASEGERLVTLDENIRSLNSEDLVIADDNGAIGLAGIMGGLSTAVSDSTSNVLIEAAHFEEVSISRSSRRHKISSEAAKRFARGVDPQLAGVAAEKTALLLRDLAQGHIGSAVTDCGEIPKANAILLARNYVSRRVGIDYSAADIENTLVAIGCQVEILDKEEGDYQVTVPSWRMDLVDAAGLSEEVARLVGYHKIPSRRPQGFSGQGYTVRQVKRRRVADALAASGLTEVSSYPFASERANTVFASRVSGCVSTQKNDENTEERSVVDALKIANPLSAEFAYLRRSLLTNLTTVARRNISRGFKDIALYEIGTVFIPCRSGKNTVDDGFGAKSLVPPVDRKPSAAVLEALNLSLPWQPTWVAAIFSGSRPQRIQTEFHAAGKQNSSGSDGGKYTWADAIDSARFIADVLKAPLVVRQGHHQAFHPGRTAELAIDAEGGSRGIGFAGELHPHVIAELGLPERTVAMELSLEDLIAASPHIVSAVPISTYPATTQDIALIVDEGVPAQELRRVIEEHAGELLEEINLFDDYRGEGIGRGEKSLAFSMSFRANDRTLTAEEVSAAKSQAAAAAAKKYGARLRA